MKKQLLFLGLVALVAEVNLSAKQVCYQMQGSGGKVACGQFAFQQAGAIGQNSAYVKSGKYNCCFDNGK